MEWMTPLFLLSDLGLHLWEISDFKELYKTANRSKTHTADTMGQERRHGTFQVVPTESRYGLPRLILSPESLASAPCAQGACQRLVLKAETRSGSSEKYSIYYHDIA